jgi:hypothetical protein
MGRQPLTREEEQRYEVIKATLLADFNSRAQFFANTQGAGWAELETAMWAVQGLREIRQDADKLNELFENVAVFMLPAHIRKWREAKK